MDENRKITEALRGQFDSSMQMMENLVAVCPAERWSAPCCQIPFWQQVYHVVFYIDYWMRRDFADDSFRSMEVDPRITHELVELPPDVLISREDMAQYLKRIWEKTARLFDDLNDETIGREAAGGTEHHTRTDIITGQIRHIMYNIGYLNAFLRSVGLPESDWYAYNEEPGS